MCPKKDIFLRESLFIPVKLTVTYFRRKGHRPKTENQMNVPRNGEKGRVGKKCVPSSGESRRMLREIGD